MIIIMIFIIAVTFFLTLSERRIYLFIYERISAVLNVFHSAVTEGPTDYLKTRQRIFSPYLLWLEI